jgi:hypothetical protein
VIVQGIPIQNALRLSNVTLEYIIVYSLLLVDQFLSLQLCVINISDSCLRVNNIYEVSLITSYIIFV